MSSHLGLSAAIWSFLEKLSSQAVSFIIGIILARLLTPYDYGVVGLTAIFIAISNVFIEAGFANALIQNQHRTEKDLSTAFYFNVVVGLVCYIVLWVVTPSIANWFNEPLLIPLLKIVGLNVVLNSLCIVQTALLTAKLNIRLQTIINLSAQVPAGILAIIMAYKCMGVYALALQTVLSSFIKVVLLWIFAKWIPKEKFNKNSFISLWRFGSRLLGANLIGTAFNQIYSIIIGKFIGKKELGYFSKANGLCSNVDGVTTGIVQRVALPVLAKYQDDERQLTEKFREIMRLLVMLIAPMTSFLCFASDDIVVLLWTEKWLDCSLLFKILIVGIMFGPVGQMSLSLMQALGKTGMVLKLEFPKKFVYCICLSIGFYYGVVGLAIAQVFINIIGSLINVWATRKILPYSYVQQLKDISIYILIAFAIGWCVSWLACFASQIVNITILLFLTIFFYSLVLFMIKDSVFKRNIKNIYSLWPF